jgi:hypothetical protein
MMKKPERVDIFRDVGEAVSALSEFGKSFVMPCVEQSAGEIAHRSARGAWIKPLGQRRSGTVQLFARWAGDNVPRMIKSAHYVINQEQFDRLIRRTGRDLLGAWRDLSTDRSARLSLGVAYRVVDMLFMAINESEACRSGSIQGFLHIPLDGSTLRPLRFCVDELLDRDFAIDIPAVVPAGFVATEEQYILLQDAIFALAARADVPPITYAYFCGESC